MSDSPHVENIQKSLQSSLEASRQEALTVFVEQLMFALAKQDYRLNDLLGALVIYSRRRTDWRRVTEHLLLATDAVLQAKRELTGGK